VKIYWKLGDPWIYLLLATIAAAIAMVGAGFWSVDARLYGWKRIYPLEKRWTDSPFRASSAVQTSVTCSSVKSSTL
jgi:hypothetical protein